MKKFIVCLVALLSVSAVHAADPQQRFSPEKYQADLEGFITKEASLTQEEATKFFPLFREMQKKQRSLYAKMRKEEKVKPSDENACKELIQRRDQVELELKTIQQAYHKKFFSVLSPSKVYDVIQANDRFHRHMFRNWGQRRHGQRPNPGHRPTPGA